MTDRFGGVFEGRVAWVDNNLRDNSDDFFAFALFCEGVVDSLSEPVSDLTLTHGDSGFERHGRGLVGGSFFFVEKDVADLRAVAMGDDDVVFLR